MTEKSSLIIEELVRFQLPAVAVFDPEDLVSLIFHDEDRNPHLSNYPPVVYCNYFRRLTLRTVDTPERTVSLRKISLSENNPEEASIVSTHLIENMDYCFMSPAHILPLARSIIDNERQKWKNVIQSQQRYEMPWKNGMQHTLFNTFIVDKHFALKWIEVDFNWYDEAFGLGISCLEPDNINCEWLVLATYIEKNAP